MRTRGAHLHVGDACLGERVGLHDGGCPLDPIPEPTAHGAPVRRHEGEGVPRALAHVHALLRVLLQRVERASPVGAEHEVDRAPHEGLVVVMNQPDHEMGP